MVFSSMVLYTIQSTMVLYHGIIPWYLVWYKIPWTKIPWYFSLWYYHGTMVFYHGTVPWYLVWYKIPWTKIPWYFSLWNGISAIYASGSAEGDVITFLHGLFVCSFVCLLNKTIQKVQNGFFMKRGARIVQRRID